MPNRRIGFRRLALAAAVSAIVAASFAVTSSAALASGDRDTDSYTVNISPGSAPAGAAATFDVALTNTSSPGSGLDSAILVPPRGFQVTSASLPAGATGSAQVLWNLVWLRQLALSPGSTLHVTVGASAPSNCSNAPRHWDIDANEGGFWGEDLHLQHNDSSLATTVTCAVPTAVQFLQQPSNTTVNQTISGSADNPAGPPVTVQIVDAAGNLVDSSAPVTVALGSNPGSATLGGTLTQNAVHGVATFNDLSLGQPGVGYTLTASGSGLTGTTSNAFNEDQTATTLCSPGAECQTSLGTSLDELTVSANPNNDPAQNPGTLTESVDLGTQLSCAPAQFGGYNDPDPNWYGFTITGSADKQLSNELFNVNPDGVQICFGANADFITSTGNRAAAGTLPDGTPGFIGLLPSCSALDGAGPCIVSIGSFSDGHSGTLVTIDIPQSFAGDPFMRA